MDTISMNSKNSKTSDPHRLLLLSLADKIDLIKNINILFYQILAFTIHRKIFKSLISLLEESLITTIHLKCQLQYGMKNLVYLMGCIRCQIFKIILNIYLKNM